MYTTRWALVRRLSDTLAVVARDADTTVWSAARTRKQTVCAYCETPIVKGETAFRPLGNKAYRFERVHGECLTIMDIATTLDAASSNG